MIEKYPSKILSTKSEPCTLEEGVRIAGLLLEEAKKLKWGTVVGLAAPQIGINKRVFMAEGTFYVNPDMAWMSPQKKIHKEGCYSLTKNKFDYQVRRSLSCILQWTDLKGEKHKKKFEGFSAQVIQHEYDHLEGRLCSGQ